MNPRDQAGAHLVGQLGDLVGQLGRAGRDQGRDERGGAVPQVQCRRCRRVSRVRRREACAAPAVHMCVDEAGHHRRRTEVGVRVAGRSTGADRMHRAVGNLNPARSPQFSTGEHGVGAQQH